MQASKLSGRGLQTISDYQVQSAMIFNLRNKQDGVDSTVESQVGAALGSKSRMGPLYATVRQ